MKRVLAFETVAFDTHSFPAGSVIPADSSFTYFKNHEGVEGADVTKEGEEAIIKWLLRSPANDLLLKVLGVGPSPFVAISVKQPVIENPQEKPGDIDILICEGGRADQAIAIQCKPVIVRAFNQDEDDVNKLPGIKDAVTQANKQREKLGFHQNYLAIIVKALGRKRNKSNVLFRGPTKDTMKLLYEFPHRESLHEDVGIVFIDISQPTAKGFDDMAVVGICHDKQAARLVQLPDLTNRVREYMGQL